MTPTPEIAVIMSVYNGLPYLEEAIASILSQTFRDFEFVIVDDASTDGTWDLLATFAARDRRIVLLRNEANSGASLSRNRGIAMARADNVAFMDADDLSRHDRLRLQIEFLKTHPTVGLVGAWPEFIDAAGQVLEIPQYAFLTENADIQRQLPDSNCIRLGSVMIRGELLDRVGLFDPELEPAEDYDLWLRMAEVTEIVNLQERLYKYREHAVSLSSTRRHLQVHNKATALERALLRRFGEQPPRALTRLVGRDFLRAAFLAAASGEMPSAMENADDTLRVAPWIFNDEELLQDEAWSCFSWQRSDDQEVVVRHVFDEILPHTAAVARAKQDVVSRLHLREVFDSSASLAPSDVGRHWIGGVMSDPRWLLNRGVLAIGVRLLLTRLGLGAVGGRRLPSQASREASDTDRGI